MNDIPQSTIRNPQPYYICTARPHLNVRESYKISAPRIGKLLFGAQVLVLSHISNGWKKIAFPGGCAYVSGKWLSPWWWQAWPTDFQTITQKFGARPDVYQKYGLPGHEGLDIRAFFGTAIYAVNEGLVYQVTNKTPSGKLSNYGWHVRIKHPNIGSGDHLNDGSGTYRTIYAHLAEDELLPQINDLVSAGQRIGTSGATGNVWPKGKAGAHLHLSMKDDQGLAGWPYHIIDPSLFSDLWLAHGFVKEYFG